MPPVGKTSTPCQRVLYLGLDPGVTGGLAALGNSGAILLSEMPDTYEGIWNWFTCLDPPTLWGRSEEEVVYYAALERVGGFITPRRRDKKTGQMYDGNNAPGSMMFKFGEISGALKLALVALPIPPENCVMPHPKEWQRVLGIEPRRPGEKPYQWKTRLAEFARSYFPSEKIGKKAADALLLAEYCRRRFSHEESVRSTRRRFSGEDAVRTTL